MGGLLKKAARCGDIAEQILLGVLICGMVGLATVQIVLRHLSQAGLPVPAGFSWAGPVLNSAVLWVAMLGAFAATGMRKHIRIDIVSHILKGRARRVLEGGTRVFAAFLCACLTWTGGRYVWMLHEHGHAAFLDVPDWVVYVIVPIGFGLMTVRFVLHAGLAFFGAGPYADAAPEGDPA
jgi:TRAP-type C4-dicarboxylate transport system permease small subunit